jgi:hypothetical protein
MLRTEKKTEITFTVYQSSCFFHAVTHWQSHLNAVQLLATFVLEKDKYEVVLSLSQNIKYTVSHKQTISHLKFSIGSEQRLFSTQVTAWKLRSKLTKNKTSERERDVASFYSCIRKKKKFIV